MTSQNHTLIAWPFLQIPDIKLAFDIFKKNSIKARFVGGCVRDALLNIESFDYDMAVNCSPDVLKNAIIAAKRDYSPNTIDILPTGIAHGTQTLLINKTQLQITSLRKDILTDGRHAQVIFGGSWEQDALRRDFTINALYVDEWANLYDPTEQGLADIKSGTIRFIGDASMRIREDYLRILRYFRFQTFYGKTPCIEDYLKAFEDHRQGLLFLSSERITAEFLKIMNAQNCIEILKIMGRCGVLGTLFHNFNLDFIQSLSSLENELKFKANVLTRLSGFMDFPTTNYGNNKPLNLTNDQRTFIKRMANTYEKLYPYNQSTWEIICREIFYDYGFSFLKECLLFVLSNCLSFKTLSASEATHIFIKTTAQFENRTVIKFPIGGSDLNTIGINPGKQMGTILQDCKNWWIQNDFKPNRDECLNWINVKYGPKN